MPSFINNTDTTTSNASATNPGGFTNTTNGLTAVVYDGPVAVTMPNPLPTGTNHLGEVSLSQVPLPAGTNTLGYIGIISGQTLGLIPGTQVTIGTALPTGSNTIGNVGLTAGTTVGLSAGTSVLLGAGANTIGNVNINGTVPISGSVSVSSLPGVTLNAGSNTIGNVGIAGSLPTGTNHLGEVSLASGTTVSVSSLTLTSVSLNAGSNAIGTVSLNAPLPTGTNSLGTVGLNAGTQHVGSVSVDAPLPTGSNTVGNVGLNTGTNSVGKVDVQGRDINSVQRTVLTDSKGALVPVNCIVTETVVNLTADTSTQLLGVDPTRLLWKVQLTTLDDVLISETGNALVTMNDPGTLVVHGGLTGVMYTPPMSTNFPVTAICHADTKVRVTTYSRV